MPKYNRTVEIDVVTESDENAITVGTDAYTANDCVGGLLAIPGIHTGGVIRKIRITDAHNQSEPYILHFFSEEPTAIADDAAMALADADSLKKIDEITLLAADYSTENGSAYAIAFIKGSDCDIDFAELPDGKLYVYLQCTDTPDYNAATDLAITVWVWLD